MLLNKLITEWVSYGGANARSLRAIYLPVKYEESDKSLIPGPIHAAEYPKKGGHARNTDCKYMYLYEDRPAQRIFL